MRTVYRRKTVAGVVAVFMLFAVSCSSSDEGSNKTTSAPSDESAGHVQTGLVNQVDDGPAPKDGGTLKFSESTATLTLDPTIQPSTGANGKIVLAAIYDELLRYDVAKGTFEPQLAKSIDSNDEFTEWTLTLRDGVSFTDGTPLDAKAIVFSFERYGAAPKANFSEIVKTIKATASDETTVVFELEEPWAAFPSLLAGNAGMVVSPTAVKAEGDDYPNKPVGAGPFKLESYAPGEKIELVRNDDYWGDKPHLDKVEVTSVADPAATVDRLETGEVKMAFVAGAKEIYRAEQAGFPGYVADATAKGWVLNTREGHPTHDVRVRQAIAHAINSEDLDRRVEGGVGLPRTTLFGSGSPLATEADGPAYDPAKAEALVSEVKKEGTWDGSIRLLVPQSRNPAVGLATEAMLNAVGFKAELVPTASVNDLVTRVSVDHNYDMASYGIALWDSDPWSQLHDGQTLMASGYDSAEFTELVNDLALAGTQAQKKTASAAIQTLFTQDVPFVVTNGNPLAVLWTKDVHGLVVTSQATVLLDKAYLDAS